jgi:ribosomal-protein-alanine N-acetyltransferase
VSTVRGAYAQVSPSLTTRVLSERLVLRPPRPADIPELRHLLRANANHLRPWSPLPAPGEDPTSLTGLSNLVTRQRRDWKRGDQYVLLVSRRMPGEPLIGRVALGGVMRGVFQNAYLGYWIDHGHQGQGLMTEAVSASLAFGFTEARLHRVQVAIMPRNAASLRVVEKVGFRREGFAERYLCIGGTWEDHVIFAMTVEEWEVRRPAEVT